MDIVARDKFLTIWKKYFNNAELPITFYYTDQHNRTKPDKPEVLPSCIIAAMAIVRAGQTL